MTASALGAHALALAASWAAGFLVFRLTREAFRLGEINRKRLEFKIRAGLARRDVPLRPLVEKLEGWILRLTRRGPGADYLDFLSGCLERAARRDRTAPQLAAYQALLALSAFLLLSWLAGGWLFPLAGAAVAAFLPFSRVRDEALRRENRILGELPNALEVLSLCAEAGLGLDQGLAHYLHHSGDHPLAEELGRVAEQTKLGASRREALQGMAGRLGLTDVSLFATSVVHAEKFGTGIAPTLRQLSATLRDAQVQRAEKAVNELPVKLMVPLVLLILPVTFLVIFGPVLLGLLP